MSALAASTAPMSGLRPITTAMRIALGMLHAGALYREPGGHWRSRAYPEQPVRDATVRALEERGLARMEEYQGLYGVRRACLTLTLAGSRAYGGIRSGMTAPPVAAESVLREVEMALQVLDEDGRKLAAQIEALAACETVARRLLAKTTAELQGLQVKLSRVETGRQALDARRVDLRALVFEAGTRIGETLAEARGR